MFLTTKCLPYSITASSVSLKLSTISELCYFVNRQILCDLSPGGQTSRDSCVGCYYNENCFCS